MAREQASPVPPTYLSLWTRRPSVLRRRPTRRRPSLPYFPLLPSHTTSAAQRTERVTAIFLFSLAPLRLTHRRLLSRTPGTASRFQTLASKEAAASTVSGPGGGAGSGLLSVLDRALTDEEQYCRERAQVQRKGMEAERSAVEGISAGRARDLRHCAGPILRQWLVQQRIHKLSSSHGTTIKFWDISRLQVFKCRQSFNKGWMRVVIC